MIVRQVFPDLNYKTIGFPETAVRHNCDDDDKNYNIISLLFLLSYSHLLLRTQNEIGLLIQFDINPFWLLTIGTGTLNYSIFILIKWNIFINHSIIQSFNNSIVLIVIIVQSQHALILPLLSVKELALYDDDDDDNGLI